MLIVSLSLLIQLRSVSDDYIFGVDTHAQPTLVEIFFLDRLELGRTLLLNDKCLQFTPSVYGL